MSGILSNPKVAIILAALTAGMAIGCGEKSEPPLTTDKLDSAQVTKEANPQTGGPGFQRPQPNPNAPYSPRR